MDTIEDSSERDPGSCFQPLMYADREIMERRRCTQEAKGRADRPPTLGDASRKTRRKRGGARQQEKEGCTEQHAAFPKERPVLGLRAHQMLLPNLRAMPERQGGADSTRQSCTKPRAAPTVRPAHHTPAPEGRQHSRRQERTRQPPSSQGPRTAPPAPHASQERQTAPRSVFQRLSWADKGFTQTHQERREWIPAAEDCKSNKSAPVISIVATSTASQVEAQRPPALIISTVSSEDASSPTQAVPETAVEQDTQMETEDEAEAASSCEAEPEESLAESISLPDVAPEQNDPDADADVSAEAEEAQCTPALITSPSSEVVISANQAVSETALDEDGLNTDIQDEADATSTCTIEPEKPLALSQSADQVEAQRLPAIISPPSSKDTFNPSQAVLAMPLEEDEGTDIEDELEIASPWEAQQESPRTAEETNEGALVVYQPPLQGISTVKVAAPVPGTLPLPYMGEVIIISLKLMLFVDCLLLNGYTITAARPQQLLTCPEPAAASTPATVPGPAQDAEPAFSNLADAMDAAWFGQAAPVASAQPSCHAEAAAASAPPSPQKEQGAAKGKKRRGFLGFVKALLCPCLGRSS